MMLMVVELMFVSLELVVVIIGVVINLSWGEGAKSYNMQYLFEL